MDDVEIKREEVKKAYPDSQSWQERVDKMSSSQIIAIHIRFTSEGKLGK